MEKRVFVFMDKATNDGMGVLVCARSVDHAKELLAEPALEELGTLGSATFATLEFERELGDEELLIVALTKAPVITEAKVMSFKTSLEAFKDETLKLFGTERYLVAAKDKDDALAILEAIVKVDPKAQPMLTLLKDHLNEKPKEQFAKVPKAITRAAVEWYRAQAEQRANEPLELPANQYVM